MTGEKNELISVREAAKECGRNMETIRRWVWSGKVPAEKMGNQLFIRRSDLAGFCRETATAPYRAGTESDLDSDVGAKVKQMREDHMKEIRQSQHEVGAVKRSPEPEREDFLERAIAFRAKLKARGVKEIDAGELIREIREERANELDQRLRGR
jgi:excisionase family DNA binding protein